MVEAGGVEPPSEKDSREASTGLDWALSLALGFAPNQGGPRPVHRKVSRGVRQTQPHASPMRFAPPRLIGREPDWCAA